MFRAVVTGKRNFERLKGSGARTANPGCNNGRILAILELCFSLPDGKIESNLM